ncbi:nuclear factor interleukin-3-regulated protein-like isoform X2 [Anneissia japonica]|uniref:nuclear factor interleukin-3-regulated protein-like isoform X2 n=1 Tax=Anneissia japonica TaxID=1529436 RepID=UPI0014256391|nr:nuclear factor interleukin-3-regulated protein-like isoform X2 [Anneissia japonica]
MANYKGRTGRRKLGISEWAIFSGPAGQEFPPYSYTPMPSEEPQNLCIRAPPTQRRTTILSSSASSASTAYVSQALKLPLEMPIKQEPNDNFESEGFLTPTRLQFQPTMNDSVSVEVDGSENDSALSRKERAFMPENRKDDNYWVKRRKNNEAAKRSREKRRALDHLLESKVLALNEENSRLKRELDLFMGKDRVTEKTKQHLNGTVLPLDMHHRHLMSADNLSAQMADRKPISYDFMYRSPPMARLSNRLYPYTMPSMCSDLVISQSERSVPQFFGNDKQVFYLASSSKGTIKYETKPNHTFLTSQHSSIKTSPNGHYDSYEPANKRTRIETERNDKAVNINPHGDDYNNDNNSDDVSKSDVGDVSNDHRSSSSPGRLSPTHSAFASGIDAKRLPHKLRAKLGAVSPTESNTPNSPTFQNLETQDDSTSLSRVNLEKFNADDSTVHSDLRNVRLEIGGICTPPSSTTSEDNAQSLDADKNTLTTKTSQAVEKNGDEHSFEIKQEPTDWTENINATFTSTQATRLSHERMMKAAQALTEMEASEARTQKSAQSSQMSSNDAKYWEKRRRNNFAARKCRESKRLLHEYRCARASYLEHENSQLHSEIDILTKDVASLKEMLKAKQQLRVA